MTRLGNADDREEGAPTPVPEPVSTNATRETEDEDAADLQQQYLATGPDERAADRPGRTDWVVFGVAAVLVLAFIAWGVLGTESLNSAASAALDLLVADFGWAFVIAGTAFVFFAVCLSFSRFGQIRLGRDDEEPEFRTSSWIAMMFAAGMGIGLMFFGVNEPLSHFTEPAPGSVAAGSDEAVGVSMATSLFHWTLHPWSIYAVVGLALAYSTFRRGRPQLLSSAFSPFYRKGEAHGPVAKIIDILAVFATVFGTAASLGIGTTQIASGLNSVGWIQGSGEQIYIAIITVLIACFVMSAVSGVAKGIQWLSNTNMVLAGLLALFLFVVGPTVFILNLLPNSIGAYLGNFGDLVSRAGATGGSEMHEWLSTWTIFYWAWWISWSPFVGMFIARISRGRTVRQFVGGVVLVPTVISLVWFVILGGNALFQQRNGTDLVNAGDSDQQLFVMMGNLPWSGIVSVIAMLLIINFFITSADSASVVVGSMSQNGSQRPRRWIVVFWGLVVGAVAAIMLVSGGEDALTSLQSLTIIAASPFLVVVIFLCFSMLKDLRSDPLIMRHSKGAEVLEQAVITGVQEHQGEFQLEVSPAEPNGDTEIEMSEGEESGDAGGSGRSGESETDSAESRGKLSGAAAVLDPDQRGKGE